MLAKDDLIVKVSTYQAMYLAENSYLAVNEMYLCLYVCFICTRYLIIRTFKNCLWDILDRVHKMNCN